MIDFEDYPVVYEYLPVELQLFFSLRNEDQNGIIIHRTLMEFCEFYKEKYDTNELPQPRIVGRVCDILVENGRLSALKKGGFDNVDNSYLSVFQNRAKFDNPYFFKLQNNELSCIIYGFKFIYELYKQFVLPVLHTNQNNDISIGTCFLYRGGILTAKHCMENAKKIAIEGFTADDLKMAHYYIHDNNTMDLIYIKLPIERSNYICFNEEAEILDEVIALGFPKIPGFHNFLTAEKALVSSRFTGTKGSIASIAADIWIKENLFLITAKIRGGNSGGPIINKNGSVVGIASSVPEGEGAYDDLGYGTVIPIKFGNQIIERMEKKFDTSKIQFEDFRE